MLIFNFAALSLSLSLSHINIYISLRCNRRRAYAYFFCMTHLCSSLCLDTVSTSTTTRGEDKRTVYTCMNVLREIRHPQIQIVDDGPCCACRRREDLDGHAHAHTTAALFEDRRRPCHSLLCLIGARTQRWRSLEMKRKRRPRAASDSEPGGVHPHTKTSPQIRARATAVVMDALSI